jgi:hypothetical protein
MYAFLSYQTADKAVAGKIQSLLRDLGISSFLAHEDIAVSEEWRLTILEEIEKTDLFIPILSANYYGSDWCQQESGIAAFRKTTVIPLSIDGTTPKGFLSHIQSRRIDPNAVRHADLFPGLAKRDVAFVIDAIINMVAESGSFRSAEANFQLILPHLPRASETQVVRLLESARKNGQVYDAALCARDYLPPLIKSHGHLLDTKTREFLEAACVRYAR